MENNSIDATLVEITIPNYAELAVIKLNHELESFKGGVKEKTVSTFVASTLSKFCEEDIRFAEAVYKTARTLSECCAEIMHGSGNQISDISVYRAAVQHYFPNADIHMHMTIELNGNAPTDDELSREAKHKPTGSDRKIKSTVKTEPKSDDTIHLSLF
jgi:hypothetical protein